MAFSISFAVATSFSDPTSFRRTCWKEGEPKRDLVWGGMMANGDVRFSQLSVVIF